MGAKLHLWNYTVNAPRELIRTRRQYNTPGPADLPGAWQLSPARTAWLDEKLRSGPWRGRPGKTCGPSPTAPTQLSCNRPGADSQVEGMA